MKQHIKELQSQLDQHSDQKTKKWFDNYLKGAIEYRGVKTPKVRELLEQWYKKNQLHQQSIDDQLKLVDALMSQPKAEDKFAGIFYIQKYLLKETDKTLLLKTFDQFYKKKYFFDWSTTDWFCVRILDPFILQNDKNVAEEISSWRKSKNLWQRRSAIVAFRGATKLKKYHPLMKTTIADLVKEDERFIQTGVGWVISDLSRSFPKEAERIVEKHFEFLSTEVIDRHTKYLSDHKKYKERKREE